MKDAHEDEQLMFEHSDEEYRTPPPSKYMLARVALAILLVLNLTLGIVLAYLLCSTPTSSNVSRYAKLDWTHPETIRAHTKFYDPHRYTQSQKEWAALHTDDGVVAISDEEAKDLGLPPSQRFPWDDTKGIYHIGGYHDLHCLKWVWTSLTRYHDSIPFDVDDWYAFHCLDALRQSVVCFADDTPRATGLNQPRSNSGEGQQRSCRDWTKLEDWAKERTACYRSLSGTNESLDRYKFCPPGHPYGETVRALFGTGEQARLLDLYGNKTI